MMRLLKDLVWAWRTVRNLRKMVAELEFHNDEPEHEHEQLTLFDQETM